MGEVVSRAWFLRRIAGGIDRLRWLPRIVGDAVDRLDRALADLSWECRSRASRVERDEVDDGIPF